MLLVSCGNLSNQQLSACHTSRTPPPYRPRLLRLRLPSLVQLQALFFVHVEASHHRTTNSVTPTLSTWRISNIHRWIFPPESRCSEIYSGSSPPPPALTLSRSGELSSNHVYHVYKQLSNLETKFRCHNRGSSTANTVGEKKAFPLFFMAQLVVHQLQ